MVKSLSGTQAILLCLISSILAQSIEPTYGDNYTPVNKDDEAISRNYPDIDIDLLSPAFLNPETIPEGFANGTSGPTPDHVMRMSIWNVLRIVLMATKTTSSRTSHLAMTGTITMLRISRQNKDVLFPMFT